MGHEKCTLAYVEMMHILNMLKINDGNRTNAARDLGISMRTLLNKINLYRRAGMKIEPPKTGVRIV